ncbi:hypothetical protein CXG81DRAFT_23116 [Caulochytrium protostelioides]|uniref:Ribosomal protein L22e n=1 Tax=Caulochytrium protostelioides TaxID=1555241 RepID=A0A4P9XFI9_9FUNG|nr:hypothetical protein CXG81DRAFT_23116 [Caulochytrium protostelioides]|eukprot:RKP04342.1 hypothetical protein CXG81DRAFT_23116 [Caulochytrium protostelioides]
MVAAKSSAKTLAKGHYVVDVATPVADGIFDIKAYELFLQERIKVHGRTKNLGDLVTITRDGEEKVIIDAKDGLVSKHYVKYLTKKFMKKHNLRDWLRVVASNKQGYVLKYFNVEQADEE